MDIFKILDELKIKYDVLEHQAVYTVEEAKQLEDMIEGLGCKNLFLTDKKGNYFLLVLEENKKANLKELAKLLNVSKLTFASSEDLFNILGLEPGSVTPLSIINDKENKVLLIIDNDIVDKKILVHPNTNTKTMSIEFKDIEKIIEHTNHKYILYKE